MSTLDWPSILSGKQTGLAPSLLRGGLSLLIPFYRTGVATRNFLFDVGIKRTHSAGLPAISIGNITTGGTGKTPLVVWVVNKLVSEGYRPAILSRGYRSLDGQENDEKRLLDQLCPEVPHIQNPDRVAGSQQIQNETDCNAIVLDDGFQHRRLERDLDIVLIDALNPWGYGRLLPRGLLREPKRSLRRADIVILTRADQIDDGTRQRLLSEIARWTKVPIAECRFVPSELVSTTGQRKSFTDVSSQLVGAFCGIGNPAAFRRTLCSLGLAVSETRFRAFPDHYHYSTTDLAELADWCEAAHIDTLLTTRKDLVKIPEKQIGPATLWGVGIIAEFRCGEKFVQERLSRLFS